MPTSRLQSFLTHYKDIHCLLMASDRIMCLKSDTERGLVWREGDKGKKVYKFSSQKWAEVTLPCLV